MARLRKFVAYRRLERPYTRRSKFRRKSYIRTNPNLLIVKFDMGNLSKAFPYALHLIAKDSIQLRHNAIEAARQTCNRSMEGTIGKMQFRFKVRVYPHHILRENPLASGAGADRMSTGMKCSFGKAIGIAAQIRRGQKIFSLFVEKEHLNNARTALTKASKKLPCKYSIVLENLNPEPAKPVKEAKEEKAEQAAQAAE